MRPTDAAVQNAARLLGESELKVRRWIRQGLLPAEVVAGASGSPGELLGWARRRGIALRAARAVEATPPDLLADSVERGVVLRDVATGNAADTIELAVRELVGPTAEEREGLLADVLERERLASTALGQGVAVPHPRRPLALLPDPVINTVFLREPVDWAAPDGGQVSVAFLLVSPSVAVHLEILSRLGVVLRSPRVHEVLARAPERAELVACLRAIHREP